MWIKKLELQNFQSHERTVIEFSNGLNCIVGQSRVGKTSIIRALSFLLFDEWHEKFVRTGAPSTTVSLLFDNGLYISREKGSTVNKITLTTKEGNVQVYEKFGQEMPLEVRKLIGIFPAKIDSDYDFNLNLAGQDDGAFLLKSSAPTKTRFMNRLTGAHVVDSALRTVNKERGELKDNITKLNTETELCKSKLSAFGNLDSMRSFVATSFDKTSRIDQLIETYTLLSDLRSQLADLNTRSVEINKFISWYDSVKDKFKILKDKRNTLTSLRTLFKDLTYIHKRSESISRSAENLKKEQDAFIQTNKLCPLCGRILAEGQIKW